MSFFKTKRKVCFFDQVFLVRLSDIPFEVKLSDNYELLKDEFLESEKRRNMMDQKIQSLHRTYGVLPSMIFLLSIKVILIHSETHPVTGCKKLTIRISEKYLHCAVKFCKVKDVKT